MKTPDSVAIMRAQTLENLNGCWDWQGGRLPNGYGVLTCEGISWLAHRLMWTLAYGPIPQGFFVCHTCDRQPCVNPEHLFLGIHRDNMQDMIRKGRRRDNKGSKNAPAILCEEQVLQIRKELSHKRPIEKKNNHSRPKPPRASTAV